MDDAGLSSTAELRTVAALPSVSSKTSLFACRARPSAFSRSPSLEAFVARDRADAVLGGAFHSLPQRRRLF